MPAPGPGAWELPPGAIGGVTPWVAHVRPFMLNSQSQFRPGPPPEGLHFVYALQALFP